MKLGKKKLNLEVVTLTKFHEDSTKIVDFLLIVTFLAIAKFAGLPSRYPILEFITLFDGMYGIQNATNSVCLFQWTLSFKEGGERPLGGDITHVLRPTDLTTTRRRDSSAS